MNIWKGMGTVAALFLIDIKIKEYVEKHVGEDEKDRPVLGGRFYIRKVYNQGIAMNGLEKYPEIVKQISFVLSLSGLVSYLFLLGKRGRYLEKAGMALVAGGAFGKTYERLEKGRVTDYLAIGTKNEKIGRVTFNLADVFIALGTVAGLVGLAGKK